MEDIQLARRLSVLGGLIDDRLRLRIREEAGQAYSPYAYHRPSDVYEGFGYLTAVVNCEAGQSEDMADRLVAIGSELANDGFSDEEFNRILQPRLSSLRKQQRDNGYWLNRVLLGSHELPRQLEWSRTLFEDYPAIQPEEVRALARTFLQSDRAIILRIEPEAME
jgi:zinc protease